METEVLIVGGGIGALCLSHLLQAQGTAHRVLLRSAGTTTPHVMVETLPPSGVGYLAQLQLLPLFEQHALARTHGYHSIWGSERLQENNFFFHQPCQYGLKINPATLVQALRQQQAAHLLCFDRHFRVDCDADGATVSLEVGGQPQQWRARLLVDASGRNRAVLRQLGVAVHEYDRLMAYSCHLPALRHPALTHPVLVESFASGWGIVTSLDEQRNVMTLFADAHPSPLREFANWAGVLATTRHLRDFLPAQHPLQHPPQHRPRVVGAMANTVLAAQLTGPCWLAIGDAAMSFDPLSSHGVCNALYTANRAAQAIGQFIATGEPDVLPKYAATLSKIFAEWLKNKQQVYAAERRFAHAPFWQQRQTASGSGSSNGITHYRPDYSPRQWKNHGPGQPAASR